jgi:uroporphyrinogen decarboxylase
MTNRERVLAALEHRQPEKIPYHIRFTVPVQARMAAFYGDPDFLPMLGNCLTFLDVESPEGWREVGPCIAEDPYGVRWDRSVDKDIGVVCNQMITPQTLAEYQFPDPDDPLRYTAYGELCKGKGD